MIKALLFDFSRTLLFPKDKNYTGSLNDLYKQNRDNPDFNFFAYFVLNAELIDYLKSVKEKFKLYIFTSESVQNDPAIIIDLNKVFDKIYSAKEIGLSKKDINSYKHIVSDLNLNPNEILFVDDSVENIKVSKTLGINTHVFSSNKECIGIIDRYE